MVMFGNPFYIKPSPKGTTLDKPSPSDPGHAKPIYDNKSVTVREPNLPPITDNKTIGLGIKDDLINHRGTGAITYSEAGWQRAGLTKVDWGRAYIDDYYFRQSFYDASHNSSSIRFDVSNFNLNFPKQGMTFFEFNTIINNQQLLQKTIFIQHGQQVYWNGSGFTIKF